MGMGLTNFLGMAQEVKELQNLLGIIFFRGLSYEEIV
jgi:hypothetical protein